MTPRWAYPFAIIPAVICAVAVWAGSDAMGAERKWPGTAVTFVLVLVQWLLFVQRARRRDRASLTKRSGVEYFCATCAVGEGKEHHDYCHREGVMTRPEPTP